MYNISFHSSKFLQYASLSTESISNFFSQNYKKRNFARWSLQSLAAMNSNKDEQGRKHAVDNYANNADVLLQDISYRLANQNEKCTEMLNQVIRFGGTQTNNDENGNRKNDGGVARGRGSVVKAVNQVVNNPNMTSSLKEWICRIEMIETEKQKAVKGLKNLKILHADTLKLTQQLLDNDKPTIKRFSKADQHLISSTFEQIRSRHAATVENLADIIIGLREIENRFKNNSSITDLRCESIIDPSLVDSFLRERLGIQLLCDHYVALNKQMKMQTNRTNGGGGVSVNCNFIDVLNDAIIEAHHVCDANLGIAPEVYIALENTAIEGNMICIRSGIIDDIAVNITLVRPWVHHVLVEVLKNAMSSNVEKHLLETCKSNKVTMPPCIYVRLHDTDQSLICEIMDQGVGFNGDEFAEKAFEFAFSSSGKRWDRLEEQQSYAMVRSPLGSLGVGLTLSRMMMQIFGGDLSLQSRTSGLILGREKTRDSDLVLESGCTAMVVLSRDPSVLEWNR